jgi:hypothetical protein
MAKKRGKTGKVLRKVKRPARIGFLSYLGDVQGCGTIRVMYPFMLLNHLREKDLNFNTQYMNQYIADPNFYKDYTFVQFQRSATDMHVKLYKHYKSNVQSKFKIPLVYEIDDLLIDIPEWNYASPYYKNMESNVQWLMENAQAIVVSTPRLKEIYGKFNKKIEVIPNHLPKFIWQDRYPAHLYHDGSKKVKILWAGSQNHFAMPEIIGDKIKGGDFGDELIKYIKKTTDLYDWHLMGAMPFELRSVKSEITFHTWENIFNYPRKLKSIEPDICIAPLTDNVFNSCKSNIKSLEYTALGAPGVYSDVLPYKAMSLRCKTDAEFIHYIEKLAADVDFRAKTYKKDYQRVENQLYWEEHNNLKKYVNTYLNMFGQRL